MYVSVAIFFPPTDISSSTFVHMCVSVQSSIYICKTTQCAMGGFGGGGKWSGERRQRVGRALPELCASVARVPSAHLWGCM